MADPYDGGPSSHFDVLETMTPLDFLVAGHASLFLFLNIWKVSMVLSKSLTVDTDLRNDTSDRFAYTYKVFQQLSEFPACVFQLVFLVSWFGFPTSLSQKGIAMSFRSRSLVFVLTWPLRLP